MKKMWWRINICGLCNINTGPITLHEALQLHVVALIIYGCATVTSVSVVLASSKRITLLYSLACSTLGTT